MAIAQPAPSRASPARTWRPATAPLWATPPLRAALAALTTLATLAGLTTTATAQHTAQPANKVINAAAAAAPAASQAPAATRYTGKWIINRTEESPDECHITLLNGQTIGGYEVALKPDCARAFAWTADTTAWYTTPNGALALADALRHTQIRFARDEAGDLVGQGPDGITYVLFADKPVRKTKKGA